MSISFYTPVFVSSSYLIDPFGILEPDEIYFHASRCIKLDPLLDPFPNLLVGPVLVGSCSKPSASLEC